MKWFCLTFLPCYLWQDRKQTLQQVDEFLTTKIAPNEFVDEIKVSKLDTNSGYYLYALFICWARPTSCQEKLFWP